MAVSPSPRVRVHPGTAQEVQLIRDELAAILKTNHFTGSKRYPALLVYVVETTLDGNADELKERTLGVEVFGRKPDYDTNSDTIVRFAAGEVRKRLALFYHENAADRPMQIVLPSGSYVPEFLVLKSSPGAVAPPEAMVGAQDGLPGETGWVPRLVAQPVPVRWWARRAAVVAALGAVVAVVAAGGIWKHQRAVPRTAALDQFWQPVRAMSAPVILCPGGMVFSARIAGVEPAHKMDEYPYVSMATAGALAELVDLFARHATRYQIQPASTTTLSDLREHPVVLIGGYNNEWTRRFLTHLRYRFLPSPATGIFDATDPSTTWERPGSAPYANTADYAIVARFWSGQIDNFVVVIAGVGKNGTEAAALFVTSPRYPELLNERAKDWAAKNLELVLKMEVIDGRTGAPSIEAAYVW